MSNINGAAKDIVLTEQVLASKANLEGCIREIYLCQKGSYNLVFNSEYLPNVEAAFDSIIRTHGLLDVSFYYMFTDESAREHIFQDNS